MWLISCFEWNLTTNVNRKSSFQCASLCLSQSLCMHFHCHSAGIPPGNVSVWDALPTSTSLKSHYSPSRLVHSEGTMAQSKCSINLSGSYKDVSVHCKFDGILTYVLCIVSFFFNLFSPKGTLLIWERRAGREGKRKRNINVREKHGSVASHMGLTADGTATQAGALTYSRTHNLSFYRTTL